MESATLRIVQHFATLPDPRVRGRCVHRLLDLVVIALCAVIANCDDWQQIAVFAREREDWFRRFLELPHGVPSHDTFERVFNRIDPATFQRCVGRWLRAVGGALNLPHIAIDGKTLRRSGRRGADLGPLHLVSAWATDACLSLGQLAVDGKSNEITAIPQLLELLDLKGALVTIDAMGCQTEIAQAIVNQGGSYLLTVKDNQPTLRADIQDALRTALDAPESAAACETHTQTEKGHGRLETRTCTVVHLPQGLPGHAAWPKLTTIGMCVSEQIIHGQTHSETRYLICAARLSAREFATAARKHWSIENKLHWSLDVTFREDDNRVASRNGGQNLAALRRIALSLLKRDPSKLSLACKRVRAAVSMSFLENLLRSADKLTRI
jgi:predicted transposase YbfD/YdcC